MLRRRQMQQLLLGGLIAQLSITAVGAVRINDDSQDARVQRACARLEEMAQRQVSDKSIAGLAVAVVYKDKVLLAKGFGPREVGKDALIDADTVFQLASVSKPISATVVASLVGEGKITWDSKISDLDPGFKMHDDYPTSQITIRDFYCHRSGLPEHAGDTLEDIGYNREQVLHRLRYQEPDSSFRSHYAYTNFGLTEAAVAACKAYGLTWEAASAEKLYKPLGMDSTSSTYADFEGRSNKTFGHVLVDGKWVQKYRRQPDAQSPAGGVSSSVNDMAKWLRLRLDAGRFGGKQLLAEQPLAETEHPQMFTSFNPLNGLPGFYGLGMNVNYDTEGRLHLGHSGAFALGNATCISLVPSEKLAVVVLTNSYPVGVAEALTNSFMDNALYGKDTQDWFALFKKIFSNPATLGLDKTFDYSKAPKALAAAQANESYLGTYSNELYGDVWVAEAGGKLMLSEGPNKMTFPLTHYNRDTFTYTPPGENSPGVCGVTFTIGPDGKATNICIENLNDDKQGLFTKIEP